MGGSASLLRVLIIIIDAAPLNARVALINISLQETKATHTMSQDAFFKAFYLYIAVLPFIKRLLHMDLDCSFLPSFFLPFLPPFCIDLRNIFYLIAHSSSSRIKNL